MVRSSSTSSRFIGLVAGLALLAGALPAQAAPDPDAARLAWWREARFGLFIHWGLYAIPAGEWNGNRGHGEWIRETARIPVGEYEKFRDQFNPVKFDADAWVKLAKDAGMKYIVITSKHHDGFCLFDSAQTDWDIMATPFKRDVMKELSEACRKQGLQMCWYHSIMDWHHPDYLPRRGWEKEQRPEAGAQFDRFTDYLFKEVEELLTKYGPIGVMWFDGEWESTWTNELGRKLYEHCRKLQPNVIVNNRVSTGRDGMAGMTRSREFPGDFGTPEQEIPPQGLPGMDWETCMTMNDHWGYNRADRHWKPTAEIIRMLCDIASKGGNYLLNVGPTAEGEFPPEAIERLTQIGAWMKVNGEAIYGTTASPLEKPAWGRCTAKKSGGNTTLFLQVFDWPTDGHLAISGLGNEITDARLLAAPAVKIAIRQADGVTTFDLPKDAPDRICSVIALALKGEPIVFAKPVISAAANLIVKSRTVELTVSSPQVEVRYTLDGTDPQIGSPKYDAPITLTKTTEVRARSFFGGKAVSEVVSAKFESARLQAAATVAHQEPGLVAQQVLGDWKNLPRFDEQKATATMTVKEISLPKIPPVEHVGWRFSGHVEIKSDDVWTFALTSDDGARLWIDGVLTVDHDGLHTASTKTENVALAAGLHAIVVEYFNGTGGATLVLKYGPAGGKLEPLPASALFHP